MTDTYGIEKFSGSFDKEEIGVTIIPNRAINDIRNPESLGVYVYLLSRPKGWKLNIKQLQEHFECGQDKMYRILNFLLNESFITCYRPRKKGRFTKPHYRVHLTRFSDTNKAVEITSRNLVDFGQSTEKNEASTGFSPYPDNTYAEIKGTYKTKNLQNKEYIKKPSVDFDKSTSYKDDYLFMYFYSIYPNKQKPEIARKSFYRALEKSKKTPQEFAEMIRADVLTRISNNWKDRHKSKIPFPATYLNAEEWEGEIYENESHKNLAIAQSAYDHESTEWANGFEQEVF